MDTVLDANHEKTNFKATDVLIVIIIILQVFIHIKTTI